jgi:ATP-dependent DNA helicase RecG
MTLDTSLQNLDTVGPKRARLLARIGLSTVRNLLFHYPRRYEDRRKFARFPTQESDEPVSLYGEVTKVAVRRLRGWQKLVEATLDEEGAHALSSQVVCRWFNAHWVQKSLATGQKVVVYGKPKRRGKHGICIDHPEFEVVEDDAVLSIHLGRIVPVYKTTEGISARLLRSIVAEILALLPPQEDLLPEGMDTQHFDHALRQIHFPADWDQLELARRHLVLNEFFALQLVVAGKRAETLARRGRGHCGPGTLMQAFHGRLPFSLTGAQKRAIQQIRADLEAERTMNRLLHGDVGSGKTFVAISSMLLAVEAGFQAALMAPTQVLAEQHYLTFRRWLEPLGIRLALHTGAKKSETSLPLFDNDFDRAPGPDEGEGVASSPQIIIGTHALLYDGVGFSRLGLVVIDEQHKFGVMQRARLIDQTEAPDVLVMTATPIPRTLTMTLYGDLEVSTLDELPANRGRIVTAVRSDSKIPEAMQFIRGHLEKGRQAFIVYPLIDESEKMEVRAASKEFEAWSERFKPWRCELLHGRINPAEKDAIMERFRSGQTQVLVSTTVIEVGIDVPNANIMLVENAERFGLAQLHQLRGRIGRGSYKSYCILLTSAANPEAMEKLRTLERSSDGFEIAEADLQLRGPGDLLGTAQSGLPPLRIGNLLTDVQLMQRARREASAIFASDPLLARPENLRYRLMIQETKRHALSQVS